MTYEEAIKHFKPLQKRYTKDALEWLQQPAEEASK